MTMFALGGKVVHSMIDSYVRYSEWVQIPIWLWLNFWWFYLKWIPNAQPESSSRTPLSARNHERWVLLFFICLGLIWPPTSLAKLMKDLPTSTGLWAECPLRMGAYYWPETSEREITSDTAWSSLQKIFELLQIVFEISSQLLLLIEVSRMKGGNLLFAVFLIQAIMARFSHSALWRLGKWGCYLFFD
jgi:hypothetical protein